MPYKPAAIDLGDLTEVILASVQRALEERPATAGTAATAATTFTNPRIIVGFILEPPHEGGVPPKQQ
jgi:hypothetical protein